MNVGAHSSVIAGAAAANDRGTRLRRAFHAQRAGGYSTADPHQSTRIPRARSQSSLFFAHLAEVNNELDAHAQVVLEMRHGNVGL